MISQKQTVALKVSIISCSFFFNLNARSHIYRKKNNKIISIKLHIIYPFLSLSKSGQTIFFSHENRVHRLLGISFSIVFSSFFSFTVWCTRASTQTHTASTQNQNTIRKIEGYARSTQTQRKSNKIKQRRKKM